MTAASNIELIQLLRALVGSDSRNPGGSEQLVAGVVAAFCATAGLEFSVLASGPRANVAVTIGAGPPDLLLVGHMDTAPTDEAAWDSKRPLELQVSGDLLIGLGVTGMKGALAAALLAMRNLKGRASGRVDLVLCADKEMGSTLGIKRLVREQKVNGQAAIVLGPASIGRSSWERLYVAQCGTVAYWIEATGAAGHSSLPVPTGARAVDALRLAMDLIDQRCTLNNAVSAIDGTPALVSIGACLAAGVVPTLYGPTARASIEVRTLPGQTEAEVVLALNAALDDPRVKGRVSLLPAAGSETWLPPSGDAQDTRVMRAAARAMDQVLGRVPPLAVFPASTDAGFLSEAGIPSLPAFGPGTLAAAHRPHEWLLASDLSLAVPLIEATVLSYGELQ